MGAVLSYALWQAQPDQDILVWMVVLCVSVGLRFVFSPMRTPAVWPILITEVLVGLIWVLAVWVLFPAAPDGLQIFFALVVMGAGLSSALFQHTFLLPAVGAIGFAMPATALRFLLERGDGHLFLTGITLAGWISALGLAWYLHKAFLSRASLQNEKTALLQGVESHVEQLDQLRKMEKSSRQIADDANAAKSRFLAHASHDLRQPLHAIGLLLATIPDKGQNKQTSHILVRVKQSLDVLSDLFDSLLDVALLDTGQVDVNISVFALKDILDQVVQDFLASAKRNGVRLSAVHTSVYVRTDPVILRRMVQNLVSNAITHSRNGRVLVGVSRRKNMLTVEVHDTGTGIAPKDQKRIFDEFTKVATRKQKNDLPGLGLGLAIVQRLAYIISAKITMTSELGRGSVFRIENLGRVSGADVSDTNVTGDIHPPTSLAARIAILDDDVEILKATENLVKKWEFSVDCYTGYDAETFREPDIILCDFELLQTLDGIDVIVAIRQEFGKTIPAVLITGNNSEALVKRAKAHNLVTLFKPVKPAQLRSVLLTELSGGV